MKHPNEVKVNLARYKLFKEKPSIPFIAYVEQGMAGGSFWSTATVAPQTPFKPVLLKRSPSIKP